MEDDDVAALGCITGLLLLWRGQKESVRGAPMPMSSADMEHFAKMGFAFARECRRQAENVKL